MNWSVEPKLLTLSCDDAVSGPEDSLRALGEFWIRACGEIAEKYPDGAFKVVFCESWPDSGRIIVYPSDRPPINGKPVHQRNERVCLQINFSWLQKRFDELPNPDAQSKAFEKGLKELSKTVQQLLAESIRQPEVIRNLEMLRSNVPFRICINESGKLQELRTAKPFLAKWKDDKNAEKTPEELAIELFTRLAPPHRAIPVTISGGAVYAVDLSDSKTVSDRDLVHLLVFPKLEKLGLRNTPISDEGMVEIGKLLTLRQLDLMGTQVTDEGLRHLDDLKKLWKLTLSNTAVTSEGIALLKDALPSLKIEK